MAVARSAHSVPILGEDEPPVAPMLSPERIACVLFASGEAAYSWDITTDALEWSGNAPAMLGVSIGEIASGRAYAALFDPGNPQNRHDIIHGDTQKDGGAGVPYLLRYALKHRAGNEPCWIEDTGRWFTGGDGKPGRADGVIRIVTEQYRREQELARLSASDPLTGGLNRMVLTKAIEEELENAAKFKTSFGFLIVGIDDLAHFNRSYGFGIGDQAIAAVAERLRSTKRGKDLIGRFSDNKFGILVRECAIDDLAVAGARFVNAVREAPFETSVGPLVLSVTAGGVVAPRYARDLGEIIAHAHEALDQAKRSSKGAFCAYQPRDRRLVGRESR